jgi:hypothetical protein
MEDGALMQQAFTGDDDPRVRLVVMAKLAGVKDDQGTLHDLFAREVKQPGTLWRRWALEGLLRQTVLSDQDVVLFHSLLEEPDSTLRGNALRALVSKGPSVISNERLANIAQNDIDPQVRGLASHTLRLRGAL